MSSENGFTEPFRVRLPITWESLILKWATAENLSKNGMVTKLALEGFYHRCVERDKPDVINHLILNQGKLLLAKCGNE